MPKTGSPSPKQGDRNTLGTEAQAGEIKKGTQGMVSTPCRRGRSKQRRALGFLVRGMYVTVGAAAGGPPQRASSAVGALASGALHQVVCATAASSAGNDHAIAVRPAGNRGWAARMLSLGLVAPARCRKHAAGRQLAFKVPSPAPLNLAAVQGTLATICVETNDD